MSEPTLAATIANDMAMKCGDDVGHVIMRAFGLADSQGACVLAAVAGASVAMAKLTGAMFASTKQVPNAEALDAVWRDIVRPMALMTIGDTESFDALLAMVGRKQERIDADP